MSPIGKRYSLAVRRATSPAGMMPSSISSRASSRTRPALSGCPTSEQDRLFTARGVTELPSNVLRPNTNRRVSLRTNLSTHLRDNLDVQTNIGYLTANIRLPQNDNNVLGMLPSGFFGTTDTLGVAGWGFFAPGEIFSLLREQAIERFTGSAQLTVAPVLLALEPHHGGV